MQADRTVVRHQVEVAVHFKLFNSRWRIVDDTDWTTRWVGLSSGDIYENDLPIGHYVAACYPNTDEPAQIMITLVNERLNPTLSLGLQCPQGHPEWLAPVAPECVPWGYDGGVMFGPVVSPSEFSVYTSAAVALSLASVVVREDPALHKYICDPGQKIGDLGGLDEGDD